MAVKFYQNTPEKLGKDLRKAFASMWMLNWLLGIGVVEYPIGKPRRTISFIYTSVILLNHCFLACYTYPYLVIVNKKFNIKQNIVDNFFFSSVVVTISVAIMGWTRNEDTKLIMEHIAIVDHLLEKLGIPKNYEVLCRVQIKKTLQFTIFGFTFMFINIYVFYSYDIDIIKITLIIFYTNYAIVVTYVVDATFVNIVDYVRFKLTKLNGVLKAATTVNDDYPPFIKIIKDIKRDEGVKDETFVIRTAKQAYLEIIKLCQQADDSFSSHVLLSVTVSILITTGTLYQLYVLLKTKSLSDENFVRILISMFSWFIYHFIKIYAFSQTFSRITEESLKTGYLISVLYDEPMICKDSQVEIRDFHLQLINNKLKFETRGFVTLDFSLIQATIASVTTHLMILVQLDNSTRKL